MPRKVPSLTVVVHRDGKNIHVPPNKPYDFTDEEVRDITGTVPDALRDPVNEERDVDGVRDTNELSGMQSASGRRMQGGSVEDVSGLTGIADETGDSGDQPPPEREQRANAARQSTQAPQGRATTAQPQRQAPKPGGAKAKATEEDDEL